MSLTVLPLYVYNVQKQIFEWFNFYAFFFLEGMSFSANFDNAISHVQINNALKIRSTQVYGNTNKSKQKLFVISISDGLK